MVRSFVIKATSVFMLVFLVKQNPHSSVCLCFCIICQSYFISCHFKLIYDCLFLRKVCIKGQSGGGQDEKSHSMDVYSSLTFSPCASNNRRAEEKQKKKS
ncbi:hypothetical protein XENOCAPTIV_011473 [Xenoophorus captivus]|uniref:Secreted protein n=1 Tax=Xenoophorus captivus TaxID=1517983 RepID=A0ABV0RZ97_9TELE